MIRSLLLSTVALAGTSLGSSEDSIGRKLAAAEKEYQTERDKAYKSAVEGLERAETAARRKGDLASLNKLKAERKSTEDRTDFPASAPPTLRKRLMSQQSKLEATYEQAIRDYTRGGDDTKAEAAKKRLFELRATFIGVAQITHRKTYRVLNRNSGLALTLRTPDKPKASKLMQGPVADDPHQLWIVAAYPNGQGTVYSLTNVGAGMAIGLESASRNQGAELIVWPENDEMRWEASPRRGGLALRWILSGHFMSVADASKDPGARVVQLADQHGELSQAWTFIEVELKGR